MSKYFLSLCAIIKDERNLEEFIIYNWILGIEHFYIYDNESSIPIKDRLNKSFYQNMCTIIDFPGKCRQIEAYNNFLNTYKNDTEWVIIVDGDEYICPKNHFSLRDFLDEYSDAHAIGINWVMFGTSFHEKKQDGYLVDKYRYYESPQNQHIKTICKPLYTKSICIHNVELYNPSKYIDPKKNIIKGPFNNNFTTDIIQINHYCGKSVEELHDKYNRENADSYKRVEVSENPHSKCNNFIDNYLPDKYLSHIIKINGEIV